ncbi:hypothetical protein GCM10010182_67260 [Actinomadura cremea]|nr:hypothetical protein GCM10010182_67260 [Actinomadura cremea]
MTATPIASDLAAELFNAVQVLRGIREPNPSATPLPDAYIDITLEWFLACHDELSRVGRAADMHRVDPLTLVDEPDSVRRALAMARAVLGSDR